MEKIVLVTGAGRGIGAATAKRLAQPGYAVCVNYHRDEGSARQLVEEITRSGGRAHAIRADVADEGEVVRLFDEIAATLGPVSHLVNNVGILESQMPVREMNAERITRVLTTNVVSAFLCAREAIKHMHRFAPGVDRAIVNVSSAAARSGAPFEYVDYAASKGAMDSFTKGLSLELAGDGIRVNAVRPGVIQTDIHADGGEPGRVARVGPKLPLGRGGRPEEVADAIAWLLSKEASFVTGSFIDIAGGM